MRSGYHGIKNEERRALALALTDIECATESGYQSAASDCVLEAAPSWGFELGGVEPPVYMWHDTADEDVPEAAGRYIAETIGNCVSSHCVEGESHNLIRRHWRATLSETVSTAEMALDKIYTRHAVEGWSYGLVSLAPFIFIPISSTDWLKLHLALPAAQQVAGTS